MDASDHDDDVGSSIHEVAKQCQEALRKCTHLWPLMEYEWAENRLAEFSLWAAGTGAFALERASLDSRLAIEWETKSLVINLLILLLGCIDKCQKAGMAPPLMTRTLQHSLTRSFSFTATR